ncbi:hypothetical protein [Solitalea lacus]|uniref:hypothetical protein n=1 Tax=Solitalea lacus TaxID=2911172 RepID=UPI001EDA89B6|nr:hypothetical protein [Solitalea lacus]UKJ06319.1 hypothetical protein L2B55_12310 [Solitalea lacus]
MNRHINQAQHNETFLAFIENHSPDDYNDWKITVIFYIAVHYIQAFYLEHGITVDNHKQRAEVMQNRNGEPVSRLCFTAYQSLYWLSIDSRYTAQGCIATHRDQLVDNVEDAKDALIKVKEFVMNYFNS